MNDVKVGGIYKHFKGHIYKVIALAKDSEDLSIKVVYENIENKEVWVRPLDEFISDVDKEKYPDVLQKKRFELLND